jgi:hypothetical protein
MSVAPVQEVVVANTSIKPANVVMLRLAPNGLCIANLNPIGYLKTNEKSR